MIRVARRLATGVVVFLFATATCPVSAFDDTSSSPRQTRSYDLRLEKRRLAEGETTIRVHQGDTVEFRWSADEATTVHLHGYDLVQTVEPKTIAVMRFEAKATGRFPVTIHGFGASDSSSAMKRAHREATILYLEVHPR